MFSALTTAILDSGPRDASKYQGSSPIRVLRDISSCAQQQPLSREGDERVAERGDPGEPGRQ